jgi:hypothetical protein
MPCLLSFYLLSYIPYHTLLPSLTRDIRLLGTLQRHILPGRRLSLSLLPRLPPYLLDIHLHTILPPR